MMPYSPVILSRLHAERTCWNLDVQEVVTKIDVEPRSIRIVTVGGFRCPVTYLLWFPTGRLHSQFVDEASLRVARDWNGGAGLDALWVHMLSRMSHPKPEDLEHWRGFKRKVLGALRPPRRGVRELMEDRV